MFLLAIFTVVAAFNVAAAQLHPKNPAHYQKLPLLRDRARIQDAWTAERISRIPSLLESHGVDAWLISQREHGEDVIWWSIKNATSFNAHRRTVVLFHANQSSLAGQPNPLVWVDNTGQVWPELRATLETFQPERIVLNTDREIPFGAGLHAGELAAIAEGLGEHWMNRTVNIPMVGVEYVASRVTGHLEYYSKLQETTWAMIEEGFSHRGIEIGVTTTNDLEWWFCEKMQEQNVSTWNHPSISVLDEAAYPGWEGSDDTIQEGDILHIDFGITAMGLNTDTQHMAYVLKTGGLLPETDAPDSLKEGLKKSNRMQDIVLENMRAGLTGNQVLKKCLNQMKLEDIEGQIFSHPIGDWGHDAGAVIGLLNYPEYEPIMGELTILPNTYYSIELYAYHFIPERNETIRFRQEEDAHWVEETGTWQFVRGRQEKFHLIDGRKRLSGAFTIQDL